MTKNRKTTEPKRDGWDGNDAAPDGYGDNIAREGWDV